MSIRIQLIERFYNPQAGQIFVSSFMSLTDTQFTYQVWQLDGQDISELNVQEYRKHLALVSQEPVSECHRVVLLLVLMCFLRRRCTLAA